MRWIGITGSCRETNKQIAQDVRAVVRNIILRGDGIVTGGAFCVDWFATDEALKLDPAASRIKVCIPVALVLYDAHYRQRAEEGICAYWQVQLLIKQLMTLVAANPAALIQDRINTIVNQKAHNDRNTQVVNLSDELYGFQVNDSQGVQDTIDKARRQGKPVNVKKYFIGGGWSDSPQRQAAYASVLS
jgi:hypothetical protein